MKLYADLITFGIENEKDIKRSLARQMEKESISRKYDVHKYSSSVNIYSYKNIYIYPECKGDILWKEIEKWIVGTHGRGGYQSILEKLKSLSFDSNVDGVKILKLLEKLDEYDFSNKSFINFLRYIPVLKDYIFFDNFHVSSIDNVIRLHLWSGDINLILHFREDFIIDYYSYDNDRTLEKETLVYTMRGTFSSSSNLKKSYKIERLLALFDRWEDENVLDGNDIKYQIYSANRVVDKKLIGD